jgi:hypothetical protein
LNHGTDIMKHVNSQRAITTGSSGWLAAPA